MMITSVKKRRQRKAPELHLFQDNQLNVVGFESPLQHLLQQHQALLRLLDNQKRFQLWIADRPMLDRTWLKQAGLNAAKIMHYAHPDRTQLLAIIENALLQGTFSYVAACIDDLTDLEKARLQHAVKASGTHLFVINDEHHNSQDFMTLSEQRAFALH